MIDTSVLPLSVKSCAWRTFSANTSRARTFSNSPKRSQGGHRSRSIRCMFRIGDGNSQIRCGHEFQAARQLSISRRPQRKLTPRIGSNGRRHEPPFCAAARCVLRWPRQTNQTVRRVRSVWPERPTRQSSAPHRVRFLFVAFGQSAPKHRLDIRGRGHSQRLDSRRRLFSAVAKDKPSPSPIASPTGWMASHGHGDVSFWHIDAKMTAPSLPVKGAAENLRPSLPRG